MNFIVKCEVYPFDVMFSFNESDKKLFNTLDKMGVPKGEYKNLSLGDCQGVYYMFKSGKSIIRLPQIPNNPYWLSILNHELLHFVFRVLKRVDIPLADDSEEAYTYLFEYISKRVFTKLNLDSHNQS